MHQLARFTRAPHETVAPVVVSRQPILDHSRGSSPSSCSRPPTVIPATRPRACSRRRSPTSACRGSSARARRTSPSRASSCSPCGRCRSRRRASCSSRGRPARGRAAADVAARGARRRLPDRVDGYRPDAGTDALLDLAYGVKLDVAKLDEEAIEAAVNAARGRGLTLIADGVQTREAYGVCRGLGFDAFQGRYFAEPVIVTGARRRPTGCARCRCSPQAKRRRSSSSSA